MKHITPIHSHPEPRGLLAPSFTLSSRYLNWLAWFRERRARRGRSRRGRRRYRGFFFKGKSLYVRGESGHIYDQRFLRTKHRSKIQRLSYTL